MVNQKNKKFRLRNIFVGVIVGCVMIAGLYWFLTGVMGISLNIGVFNSYDAERFSTSTELPVVGKPAIYLYPLERQEVFVTVNSPGGILTSYPKYDQGWRVMANSDGKIEKDGRTYEYLFWEGPTATEIEFDMNEGEIIAGRETAEYLERKLAQLGLSESESNEFITYWLPKMEHNFYNLIHFATEEEYGQKVVMQIDPKPDSVLRVMMVYKPLIKLIKVKPQELSTFERKGFTVVEWGGIEMANY